MPVTEKQKANLKRGGSPETEFKSGPEAAEAGRKGGLASGVSKRKRKIFSDIADAVASSKLDPDSVGYRSVKGLAADMDDEDVTVGALMIAGQAQAAVKGNAKAMRIFLELEEEAAAAEPAAREYRMSPLDLTRDFVEPYRAIWGTLEGGGHLREVVIRGGRGGGKSSFAAELAYEVMMRDPEANVVYLRRYRSDLRPTVYQQFCRVVAKHGAEDAWKTTSAPMQCTRIETGGSVYFFGADNPVQAKSFTPAKGYVKLLILEECDELQGLSYVQDAQLTYLRSNGGEGAKQLSLMVYNPQPTRRNWMNAYAEELLRDPDALVADASYLNVPPEWLGERFLQQAEWLRVHRPEVYRNKLLGEVTGTGSELFDNVVEEAITDEQIDAMEMHGWMHQGVDWGYEHPNVFVRVAYDPDSDTVWPVFEKYQRRANAVKFQQGIRRFRANETICDSASPDKIADWVDLGWNAFAAVKRWRDRGRSYAWEWLRSVDRIVVDPERTPNLLRELQTLEFERLKDGSCSTAYPDVGEDGVMAVIYALNRVIVGGKSSDGEDEWEG